MNADIEKNFKKPILTIAIPTFNRDQFLKKNLEIIFKQVILFKDIEIIIIDNASTDKTSDICEKYIAHDFFCYFKLKKNLGMAASQLECFKQAKGKYICLVSDDDFFEPNGLKLIYDSISSNHDLYAFNYKSAISNGSANPIGPINSCNFNFGYQLINYPSVGHMSGLVYKRKLILRELHILLDFFPLEYFNSTRGIFGIAFAALANKTGSAYYNGDILFSAIEQKNLDYNGLTFLCLKIFTSFNLLKKLNIVGDEIYDFQCQLVSSRIMKSYIRWYPTLSTKEMLYVDHLLVPFFNNALIKKLIFRIIKIKFVRYCLDKIYKSIL